MSFAWHHPSYYKKLKENSGRSSSLPSKDTTSEVCHKPSTVEVEVGHVGGLNLSATHTNHKEDK